MFKLAIVGLSMLLGSGCLTTMEAPDGPAYVGQRGWIVTAAQVEALHPTGATFLDTRSEADYKAGHLAGARHAPWKHFSEAKSPNQGKLLADDTRLITLLREAGVRTATPVVVIGDTINGWGEDGRIVWMLRTLGHTNAALLDGGHYALTEAGAGLPMDQKIPGKAAGNFTVKRLGTWDVQKAALQKIVLAGSGGVTLVDTRELREYQGAVPYGEARGGHLPGAVPLHYGSLLNTLGQLRHRSTLLQRLKDNGVTPDKEVIAYCTGGVRSAWFVAVLADLGFKKVRNYAGSMWEWSAGPADQYPLE